MAEDHSGRPDDTYWVAVRAWFASLSRWQSLGRPEECRAVRHAGLDGTGDRMGSVPVDAWLTEARESASAVLLAGELRTLLARRPDLDPSAVRLLLQSLADEYEQAAAPHRRTARPA